MLQRILSFQAEHASDVDELVEMFSAGQMLKQTYEHLKMTPPQQFTENLQLIEKEARARRRDNIERALREARARKEALKTMDEKRKDIDSNIAELERALSE